VSSVVFDIETGPQPIEILKEISQPFKSSLLDPGPFDSLAVKYGNTKDEAKRAAILADNLAKHEAKVKAYQDAMATEEPQYWADIQRGAALSALTGQVLAIGYRDLDNKIIHGVDEDFDGGKRVEADVLRSFWRTYERSRERRRFMVGFNIKDFDIPFIVQRSIIQNIAIPPSLFSGNGRYLDSLFIDLRDVWKAGVYNGKGSLDAICRACGIGAKTEGVDGSMFAELWMGGSEKRAIAKHYLLNDLDMTWQLADRCNVL
jgi:uncharacterized protein YprB with RNaseH-like and TPR domain